MIITIKNPTGNYKINGEVELQGAKNSMLNNLLLPLLTSDQCIFKNVPKIDDVLTNLAYLESLGAKLDWLNDNTLKVQCISLNYQHLDAETAVKTTGSKYFIPFIVHKFGEFVTGPSGGDKLGSRRFDDYANSLIPFGINYEKLEKGLYKFTKSELAPKGDYTLNFPSLGLTINAIFAAINCEGDSLIHNTCQEAEVDNTIELLNQMGGNVKRQGNDAIYIEGGRQYYGGEFRNMSDRNVAVSYAMLAIVTKGTIKLKNYDDCKMDAFYTFLNSIGCKYTLQTNDIFIDATHINTLPQQIKAFMFPDIHSDWQPLIAPLLTQQKGESYIEEYLFPYRLGYWHELQKMGAEFTFDYNNKTRFPTDSNPHAIKINGEASLTGANVTALDLRTGMSLIITALIAKGDTCIHNAEEIKRGYSNITDILDTLAIQYSVE